MKKTIIPSVSIISLTKDDEIGLKRTGTSILIQNLKEIIEWIIIDGSSAQCINSNKKYINEIKALIQSNNRNILIRYKNMRELNIEGIYPSMNYSRTLIKGESTIFMNGGDEFYDKNSLNTLYKNFKTNPYSKVICFGQAKIVSKIGIDWNFPGKDIFNINKWLMFLEPNHQSMLVSSNLVINNSYPTDCIVEADKYWKRSILKESESIVFIRELVCKFYLEGASSNKPSMRLLKSQIMDKRHSYLRKIVSLIKFLIPKIIYKYVPYLQMLKNQITNLIF